MAPRMRLLPAALHGLGKTERPAGRLGGASVRLSDAALGQAWQCASVDKEGGVGMLLWKAAALTTSEPGAPAATSAGSYSRGRTALSSTVGALVVSICSGHWARLDTCLLHGMQFRMGFHATQSYSPRRACLTEDRLFLSAILRSRSYCGTFVGIRSFGSTDARSTMSLSFSMQSSRFAFCVRCRWEVITTSPDLVITEA